MIGIFAKGLDAAPNVSQRAAKGLGVAKPAESRDSSTAQPINWTVCFAELHPGARPVLCQCDGRVRLFAPGSGDDQLNLRRLSLIQARDDQSLGTTARRE